MPVDAHAPEYEFGGGRAVRAAVRKVWKGGSGAGPCHGDQPWHRVPEHSPGSASTGNKCRTFLLREVSDGSLDPPRQRGCRKHPLRLRDAITRKSPGWLVEMRCGNFQSLPKRHFSMMNLSSLLRALESNRRRGACVISGAADRNVAHAIRGTSELTPMSRRLFLYQRLRSSQTLAQITRYSP
jgi:hypothetical protein